VTLDDGFQGAGPVGSVPAVTGIVRILLASLGALLLLLATAPAAFAGEGWWGPIDDKVITFFAFGAMIFFAAFVIVLSLIQMRLENRKQRAREDLERLRKP
jgi:pilus assembly protein TadC